jgi:hypothetical protein
MLQSFKPLLNSFLISLPIFTFFEKDLIPQDIQVLAFPFVIVLLLAINLKVLKARFQFSLLNLLPLLFLMFALFQVNYNWFNASRWGLIFVSQSLVFLILVYKIPFSIRYLLAVVLLIQLIGILQLLNISTPYNQALNEFVSVFNQTNQFQLFNIGVLTAISFLKTKIYLKNKLFVQVVALLSILLILLSPSKSALLSFSFSCGIFLLLKIINRSGPIYNKLRPLFYISVVGFLLTHFLILPVLSVYYPDISGSRSFYSRVNIAAASLEGLNQGYWFFGHGTGSYPLCIRQYTHVLEKDHIRNADIITGAHNHFLNVLFENGFVMMALLLLISLLPWASELKDALYNTHNKMSSLFRVSIYPALLIMISLTVPSQFFISSVLLVYTLIFGYWLRYVDVKKDIHKFESRRIQLLLVALIGLTVFFWYQEFLIQRSNHQLHQIHSLQRGVKGPADVHNLQMAMEIYPYNPLANWYLAGLAINAQQWKDAEAAINTVYQSSNWLYDIDLMHARLNFSSDKFLKAEAYARRSFLNNPHLNTESATLVIRSLNKMSKCHEKYQFDRLLESYGIANSESALLCDSKK